MIADFLLFLRQSLSLKAGTIEGYRSALASVLAVQGLDVSYDHSLHALIRSFRLADVRSPSLRPKWDLGVVLSGLLRPPFEPLSVAPLEALSWKTAFLLALASACRVSELHALDHATLVAAPGWTSVSLRTLPGFVAKNQQSLSGPLGVRSFTVPALAPTLSPDLSADRGLCPVRALRLYLDRTRATRAGRRRLFLPCSARRGCLDLSKNTISAWLRKCITECYRLHDSVPPLFGSARPHEIRAWSASLPLWYNASVEEVVAAAQWSSSTTFTSFYLRDVGQDLLGLHQLGPFIASQRVLRPPAVGRGGGAGAPR